MPRRKYARPFYETNKALNVWMPETVYQAVAEHLEKYSYGGNFSEKFRLFWFEVLKLEKEGVTFVNAREAKVRERQKMILAQFGDVTDRELICLKNPKFKDWSERDRALSCGYCKDGNKEMFKACQQIRVEYQAQKDALGEKTV